MRVRLITLVVLLSVTALVFSQAPWPRGTATTTIGGKKVTIEYGRPALHGRTLGEVMKQLPADRMWRAGADTVTILSTETPLMIGSKKVPAGKYSLYVYCAENGDYTLVLNSDPGQPLIKIFPKAPPSQANDPYPSFDYTKEIAAKEVARAPMKKVAGSATDQLTYTFQPSKEGALLKLAWGDQAWELAIAAAK